MHPDDGAFGRTVRNSYSAGRIEAELPTRARLPWFCGGTGVVSGSGTRPDPRFGRRRFRLSCYRLVGRVPVLAPAGAAGLIRLAWARGRGSRVRRPAGACHPSTTKGTAMTIVEDRPVITGGVDTHADVHVAAALDPVGGLLGVRQVPATAAGYVGLLGWPGTWQRLVSGWWRWIVRTGRTGTGRASPARCCDVRSHVVSGYVDWR